MKTYRISGLALILFFAIASLAGGQTNARLLIVHTNDLHGQILPKDGIGGLAEAATVIRNLRPDLLVDGGDMFTGTIMSDEFSGKPLIEIMNRLNYQAVALGNHEFDYGIEVLKERLREARFPVLSANVEGLSETKPYTVLAARGIRVGVIGLTTETLAEVTHPKNLSTIRVRKLVDSVGSLLPAVKSQSDFVILLAHLSIAEQVRLAKAFPEIPLIISGHPHGAKSTHIGGTTIVEAGNNARFVGRIEIFLSGKIPDRITHELIPVRDVTPDPEIAALIRPYEEKVSKRTAEVLGDATADLRKSGTAESPLPNMIADAVRAETGAAIAIHNLGGIRAELVKGPITYGDIFEILPFQNTIVTLNLSGAELKKLLGRGVLAVSGLRVQWDLTRATPNRLISAALEDGKAIEDDRQYRIAVNDFLWAGGDGLVELKEATGAQDTGILIRDVVASYVRKNRSITPKLDGRIVIRN